MSKSENECVSKWTFVVWLDTRWLSTRISESPDFFPITCDWLSGRGRETEYHRHHDQRELLVRVCDSVKNRLPLWLSLSLILSPGKIFQCPHRTTTTTSGQRFMAWYLLPQRYSKLYRISFPLLLLLLFPSSLSCLSLDPFYTSVPPLKVSCDTL